MKITPIHFDIMGEELRVGDEVVYATSSYSSLAKGKVLKVNAQTVRVGTVENNTTRAPERVIRVNKY
jgi:hypothetical protein